VGTLIRLAWACLCIIVWPIYYATLVIRWMIPPLRSNDLGESSDRALYEAFHSPPYLDRLRG
jgi:hypothetical protein